MLGLCQPSREIANWRLPCMQPHDQGRVLHGGRHIWRVRYRHQVPPPISPSFRNWPWNLRCLAQIGSDYRDQILCPCHYVGSKMSTVPKPRIYPPQKTANMPLMQLVHIGHMIYVCLPCFSRCDGLGAVRLSLHSRALSRLLASKAISAPVFIAEVRFEYHLKITAQYTRGSIDPPFDCRSFSLSSQKQP